MSNVDHQENAIHNHSSNTISTKHHRQNEVSKIIEENLSENKTDPKTRKSLIK